MALPLAALAANPALLKELVGKAAKFGGTALTAGKFLDAAIPGRSERALRQVGKDARDRLEKGQYGLSKAEQEQEASKRLGSMGQRSGFSGVNPYQLSKGITSMGQRINQKGMEALAKSLGGQEGVVREGIDKYSRDLARTQQTADVKAVQDLAKDTQARTSAIVGELPKETKAKGLGAYGLEGFASMANKKPKEDKEVFEGIAEGTV